MNQTHRVVLGSNVVLRETSGTKPGEETVKCGVSKPASDIIEIMKTTKIRYGTC